jgi:hypothetical protein
MTVTWVGLGMDYIEDGKKGLATQARHLTETECVLPVKDMKHARSAEVLDFCVEELRSGTTYNELRMKLGLGECSMSCSTV